MRVLRSSESFFESEVDEFRWLLRRHHHHHHHQQQTVGVGKQLENENRHQNQKGVTSVNHINADNYKTTSSSSSVAGETVEDWGKGEEDAEAEERMMVCVTSGVSFLGSAIARRLLSRGHAVRLILHTQEDLEKVREVGPMMFGSHMLDDDDDDDDGMIRRERRGEWGAWVVVDMMDVDRLCEAFVGCVAVFHTSSFSDPTGLSGYSKHMAENEARTAERVIEACVRSQSVRKCVFTSSLLACIWRQNSPHNNTRRLPITVDENCWSDESYCRERKLWFALGKTMAEKAAWRAARGRDLKLVTMCPGLVTGAGFRRRNSTASIAYLKGGQEMMRDGLLATVDVDRLAGAHVSVYEAMDRTACGRYICFDHIVRRAEDVAELERQLGRTPSRNSIAAVASASDDQHATTSVTIWFELSNRKLARLISSSSRRCSPYGSYSMQ